MTVHQVGYPGGVPVAQGRVVDEGELLLAAAVAAEVGRSLDAQPCAVGEGQRAYFRMTVSTGGLLFPAAELVNSLPPLRISFGVGSPSASSASAAGEAPKANRFGLKRAMFNRP
jgi:hypothetical protein